MYYEINVSFQGRHFFATAERSIRDHEKLVFVLSQIKQKFPRSEGYEITVSEYQLIGTKMEFI
jgi:hypothetical protein